jgi:hypothetical protein
MKQNKTTKKNFFQANTNYVSAAVILIVAIVGVGIAIAYGNHPSHTKQHSEVSSFHAGYSSLAELKKASDYIVMGVVIDNGNSAKRHQISPDSHAKTPPATDFKLKVEHSYGGSVPARVMIIQLPGSSYDSKTTDSEVTWLHSGDQVIVFAKKDTHNAKVMYPLAGGSAVARPQADTGKYVIPKATTGTKPLVFAPQDIMR